MSNIPCIIVDDEPLARKVLREYIEEVEDLELLTEFKSALELKQYMDKVRKEAPLVFLDINMPKLSGIDFARSFNKGSDIIFTTAYPDFAVEAFSLDAVDYLLKPISFDRFLQSIDKVRAGMAQNQSNWILVKENKRLYKLKLEEILYLQAYGDYVKIITHEKTYLTKERLSSYHSKLGEEFEQCHRSYIVNLNHVKFMEGNQVQLAEVKIPVSAGYKDRFLRQFG